MNKHRINPAERFRAPALHLPLEPILMAAMLKAKRSYGFDLDKPVLISFTGGRIELQQAGTPGADVTSKDFIDEKVSELIHKLNTITAQNNEELIRALIEQTYVEAFSLGATK